MRALVLDRGHAVLVDGDRLPAFAPASARPLADVEAALGARGLALPAPMGSRPAAPGGRDFAFVRERCAAPPGMAWRPLADVLPTDDEAWALYCELVLGGWAPPTRALDVWAFGDGPDMAARLAHLVACGAKRVTMAWVEASRVEGSPLPYEGGVSIVTDGFGYPRLALRTTRVREAPFREVTPAEAAAEGEGDLTYEDWRAGHVAFFTAQAARLGLAFTDDARIAVEHFEVLRVLGRADR